MIHMGFQGLESLYFHTPMDHSVLPERVGIKKILVDENMLGIFCRMRNYRVTDRFSDLSQERLHCQPYIYISLCQNIGDKVEKIRGSRRLLRRLILHQT